MIHFTELSSQNPVSSDITTKTRSEPIKTSKIIDTLHCSHIKRVNYMSSESVLVECTFLSTNEILGIQQSRVQIPRRAYFPHTGSFHTQIGIK